MIDACCKCGNGRNNHRWPFCITVGDGGDAFKLKVECGRCRYFWIEPSLDAESHELKEHIREQGS